MITVTSNSQIGPGLLAEILDTEANNVISPVLFPTNLLKHIFYVHWTADVADDAPNGVLSIRSTSAPEEASLDSPIINTLALNALVPASGQTEAEIYIQISGEYYSLFTTITGFSLLNGRLQVRYLGAK